MEIRCKSLKGRGKLMGGGLDNPVFYDLMHRSEDIPPPNMGEPSTPVSTKDSITGRGKIVDGLAPSPGQKLVLTLEDGRKLKVLIEFDEKITATGGFF